MFRMMLSDLRDVVCGAKKAAAVIFCSLAVTSAVILSLFAMLFEQLATLHGIESDSRFYSITAPFQNTLPRMESLDALLFGKYPEIRKMYPFEIESYQYESMFSPFAGTTEMASYTGFRGYPVVDKSFCSFLYIPSPHLLRGRWFTQQELLDGGRVLVLSKPWLEENYPELDPDTIEEFSINGSAYRVIGISDGADETLEQYGLQIADCANFIPYRTMAKQETETAGFRIGTYALSIEFDRPLTRAERVEIGTSFGHEDSRLFPMSNLDTSGTAYLVMTLITTAAGAVMIFICVLNMMGLFRSLMNLNRYRYMLYKVCGARNGAIARSLRFTTVVLTLTSGTAGCLLFRLVAAVVPTDFFDLNVPWFTYLFLLLLLTGMLLLVIGPMIRSIARRQPLDRQLWQ